MRLARGTARPCRPERVPGGQLDLDNRRRALHREHRRRESAHHLRAQLRRARRSDHDPGTHSLRSALRQRGQSIAFLCGGGGKPPCPPTEGTVTGVITAADVLASVPDRGIEAGAFEEFVQAIRAGHAYANVHTNKWPGGEIRGQIHDRDQKESVR